jgi:hypothetical protein
VRALFDPELHPDGLALRGNQKNRSQQGQSHILLGIRSVSFGTCIIVVLADHPAAWHLSAMESRVENRRSDCSLPVDVRLGFRLPSVRFDLVLFPVPAHRTRTGGFLASGSRKRLTHAPTEDSQYGVVTGPNRTQNEEKKLIGTTRRME